MNQVLLGLWEVLFPPRYWGLGRCSGEGAPGADCPQKGPAETAMGRPNDSQEVRDVGSHPTGQGDERKINKWDHSHEKTSAS